MVLLPDKNFSTVCAYLIGVNDAHPDRPLKEFRHWLLTNTAEWNNADWCRNILERCGLKHVPVDEEENTKALSTLTLLLQEFAEKIKADGEQSVIDEYEAWLMTNPHGAPDEWP